MSTTIVSTKCAWCQKSREQVRSLITGDKAAICDGCVEACIRKLEKKPNTKAKSGLPACSYCNRKEGAVEKAQENSTATLTICRDCLKLSRLIADEESGIKRATTPFARTANRLKDT